jgi:hypothetical protein
VIRTGSYWQNKSVDALALSTDVFELSDYRPPRYRSNDCDWDGNEDGLSQTEADFEDSSQVRLPTS